MEQHGTSGGFGRTDFSNYGVGRAGGASVHDAASINSTSTRFDENDKDLLECITIASDVIEFARFLCIVSNNNYAIRR